MVEDHSVVSSERGLSKALTVVLQGARDYGSVMVGVGVTRLLTFLAAVLLARSLSIGGFGVYSFAYTIMTLVAQVPLVLDASFVRNYAIDADEARRRALLRAHLHIKATVLALLAILTTVLAQPLSSLVFHKPQLKELVVVALLGGASFSMFNTALTFHQARKRFLAYSATFLFVNLMAFGALIVYLSVQRPTPIGAMLTFNTFPYALAAIATVLWLTTQSSGDNKRGRTMMDLLRFSGWLIPAGPLYILMQRIDLLVLSAHASYRVIGLYGAAVTLSSVVSLFTSQLQVVFLPKAAESISNPKDRRDYLTQAMATSASIVLVALAGIGFSPWLLRIGFGEQYAAAAQPLRLLFLAYAVSATVIPMIALLYAMGKTKIIFGERLLELSVATTLCLLLVQRYSATGVAAGVTIAYVVGALYVALNVKRGLKGLAPTLSPTMAADDVWAAGADTSSGTEGRNT